VTVDGKPRKGQWVTCPHCNADLEVISVTPLELDFAYLGDDEDDDEFWDEEEVWDEDDEEEGLWADDEDEEV
jgi:hypothetical protein